MSNPSKILRHLQSAQQFAVLIIQHCIDPPKDHQRFQALLQRMLRLRRKRSPLRRGTQCKLLFLVQRDCRTSWSDQAAETRRWSAL